VISRYLQERGRMHVRVEDLELYLLGSLPEPQFAAISSHVADCPVCGAKLDETKAFIEQFAELSGRQVAEPSLPERRRSQRVPANDPALIKLIHPSVSETLPVKILDVSRDGLKVEVPRLLEAGMTVEIILERSIAIAEVRYCIREGEVYHAGVSIQDVFAKSRSPH
jgi:anti-sigma factor RsiW